MPDPRRSGGGPLEVAIIGTGAAAFGATLALLPAARMGRIRVTLIGPDVGHREPWYPGGDPREWSARDFDRVHRHIRRSNGEGLLPPRSNFGRVVDHWPPEEGRADSYAPPTRVFGGLSDFWSTALFPIVRATSPAGRWTFETLAPFYERIAEEIGIAGDPQAFAGLFPRTLVNRPPVRGTPLAELLAETIRPEADSGYRVTSGTNLLGVETRPAEARSCVYCGGCLYGCFKESLFRPAKVLRRLIEEGVLRHVPAAVARASARPSGSVRVVLQDGDGLEFDRALLCAGAIGSSGS